MRRILSRNGATPFAFCGFRESSGSNAPPNNSKNTVPQSHKPPSSAVPKGFERFYDKEIMKRLPTVDTPGDAIKAAMALSKKESAFANNVFQKYMRMRRLRRLAIVGTITMLISGYRYAQGTKLHAADISSFHSVRVDLPKHTAAYFNADGQCIGARNFIDYFALESTVEAGKDIIVYYHINYPIVPMMLLLILPILGVLNSGFTTSARMAGKHAVQGATEKSRFRFKKELGITTKLADVAGLTEAKHEVLEVIDFLKHPAVYKKLGARLPKGVLLDGPPGVGKTLLAKAVAGEAMVPFVSCSGSEFEEVFVGVGAQRVRELFKQAHLVKPCVVFIDEIDAIGKKRKSDKGGNSRGTLNAFLSELDGFHNSTGIIVLAATNRADVLDPALTRSGRFDRKITLEKPPHQDRVAIALVHLKPLKLDPNLSIEAFAEIVASLTAGCSGADIYNICNEAAIFASRAEKEYVSVDCFHKALERVLLGMEKQAVTLSPNERERVSYHEAGVVVLGWFLGLTDPTIKTTIVPRGASHTGSTQTLPTNVYISTQARLLENMVRRLGGYVVEEHFFQDVSSVAAEDLRKVTNMAQELVCTYGMDPENVGHFGYEVDREDAIQKPFGPLKENTIDQSISKLVEECLGKARALLKEKLHLVRSVSGLLMKQETLTAQDLWVVLGDRPDMTPEFRKFLES